MDPLVKNAVTVRGNPASDSALLFVHGFGTDQTAWDAVTPAFEAEHRVVLVDIAGSGRSHPDAFQPHRYLNLRAFANDLLDVCDALKLRRVVGVGASVGGMMLALAAIDRPRLFTKLVLVGTSARYRDDVGYRGGVSEAQLAELYRVIAVEQSAWAAAYAAETMRNADRPHLAREFAETLATIPSDRLLSLLYVILQSDHRADVAQLAVPTLIVQTKVDAVVPIEAAEFLHHAIAGSTLRVIEAEGHLPHLSAPALVVEAIRDFI